MAANRRHSLGSGGDATPGADDLVVAVDTTCVGWSEGGKLSLTPSEGAAGILSLTRGRDDAAQVKAASAGTPRRRTAHRTCHRTYLQYFFTYSS